MRSGAVEPDVMPEVMAAAPRDDGFSGRDGFWACALAAVPAAVLELAAWAAASGLLELPAVPVLQELLELSAVLTLPAAAVWAVLAVLPALPTLLLS